MTTIGVLPTDLIITQLAHVAALQHVTPAELERLDMDGWARLAVLSLGLETSDVRAAVIRALRDG